MYEYTDKDNIESKLDGKYKWILLRKRQHNQNNNEWIYSRNKKYGPIIDELQEIWEDGFESKFEIILKKYILKAFRNAAPYLYQKLFYGVLLISFLINLVFKNLDISSFLRFPYNAFFNKESFSKIHLIILLIIFSLYIPMTLIHKSIVSIRRPKKSKVKYIQRIRNGIIHRNKMPLEQDFWPDFNENLIEYKVKKLSSFPVSDLKLVEDFLDRQEKIFIKNAQYLQKFTSVLVSFLVVLVPETQFRISSVALFWLFLYSLEYFMQKSSIASRNFFCIQLLKEAQIRRSKI